MLCEVCHERDARVHFALVMANARKPNERHICDDCLPAIEAERVIAYNAHPDTPPPANVESLTGDELLALTLKAGRNGVDKAAFRHVMDELKQMPATHDRLSAEILAGIQDSLQHGWEPRHDTAITRCLRRPDDPKRAAEQSALLEKLVLLASEHRKASDPRLFSGTFFWPLLNLLTTLGRFDRERFKSVIATLKKNGADPKLHPRWEVIALAEKTIAMTNPLQA